MKRSSTFGASEEYPNPLAMKVARASARVLSLSLKESVATLDSIYYVFGSGLRWAELSYGQRTRNPRRRGHIWGEGGSKGSFMEWECGRTRLLPI